MTNPQAARPQHYPPPHQHQSPRKYLAYSVHDTTMVGLLSALGFNRTNVDRDECAAFLLFILEKLPKIQ
jgi:hypothetical protein